MGVTTTLLDHLKASSPRGVEIWPSIPPATIEPIFLYSMEAKSFFNAQVTPFFTQH